VLTLGLVDYENPTFEKEIQNEQEWRVITHFSVDLVEWLAFDGDDYESQYQAIMDRLRHLPHPVRRLGLDSTGCGLSITDRFKASLTETEIVEFNFSLQSKDQLYRNFQRMIRSGEFRLPGIKAARESRDSVLFTQEMLDLEKTYSNGLMVIHHPDEAGAHDDYPDSAALMCYVGSSRPSIGAIEVGDSANFFR